MLCWGQVTTLLAVLLGRFKVSLHDPVDYQGCLDRQVLRCARSLPSYGLGCLWLSLAGLSSS